MKSAWILALLFASLYFLSLTNAQGNNNCREDGTSQNNYCDCKANHCKSCVNKLICTECENDFVLVDNKCLNCSDAEVKSVYFCNQEGFNFTAKIESASSIRLAFNRNFDWGNKPLDDVFKITFIDSELKEKQDYEIESITRETSKNLMIKLKLKRSFKNVTVNVLINKGKETFFFDSQNSFLSKLESNATIASYLDFAEDSDTQAISISTYVFEGLFLLILITSFVSESSYYVWPLLDLMQFLNLFYFLNVPLNPRLSAFLKAFGITNLDFLPDLLYQLCKLIGRPNGDYNIRNLPERFLADNKSNSFIKNFGDLFVFVIACFLLIMMLISFSKKQNKKKSYNVVTTVIIESGKILEWTGFIKIMDFFLILFSLCVGIRFKYLNFEDHPSYHAVDVTITAFTLLFYFIFMMSLFRKINHPSVYLGDPEHYRKYGLVVENVDVKRFWSRNFFLIIFLQKASLAILVPTLYDSEHQILVVSAVQLFFTVLILVSLPYGERLLNIILGLEEIIKTAFLIFLLGISMVNKSLLDYAPPGKPVFFNDDEISKVRSLNLAALSFALLSFYLYWVFYIQSCVTKTRAVRMDRAKIVKKA